MTRNPTPATLAEIRARHEAESASRVASSRRNQFPNGFYTDAHRDRAALLSMLEAGRDGVVEEAALVVDRFRDTTSAKTTARVLASAALSIRSLKSGAAVSPAAVVTEEQIAALVWEMVEVDDTDIPQPVMLTRESVNRCAKAIRALLHPAPTEETKDTTCATAAPK